ncbi:SAM-dependent methyltransferase [Peristeroidobacter agariperforans]|uniref:SAM-dependent methyltransferase n=1 Tax=Peristeroidobacter agariperforans TaxID=268404 RepID=UPI00101C12A2|nr:class I SAM-dependent methyltransferase [Peristeroidobacter agariperforans]
MRPSNQVPHPALALLGLILLALCQVAAGSEVEPTKPKRKLDVWYVATPHEVVDRMLYEAKIKATDVVYDLGCGDGRMVIAAAKQFGTRGVGVDLDPARIREARANAKAQGVEQLVTFRVGDMFETDLREATVVMLYLLPELNRRLKPKLFAELRPGARVVSHDFDMGKDWPPDRSVNLGADGIYMWVMPPLAERPAPKH